MATYKTKLLKDKFTEAADVKRWETVEKLSKGFAVQNNLAIELDNLLHTKYTLENKIKSGVQTAPKPAPKPVPKAVVKSEPKAAKKTFDKVTYNDLDADLQSKIGNNKLVQYQVGNGPKSPAIPQSDIPEFQKIVDDIILGQNVFLVGGAGTGKTTLAQNVTMALGREYMTINCSQWTSPTEIIGGQTLDGYQEGKLIEAWSTGQILILDELPKIDPNTAGLLNDALAKTKIANSKIFNSRKESFTKHPNFGVVATGNIWPANENIAYGANNKQDLSLLDRFAGCVYQIEKNVALEQSVIGSLTLWTMCNKLREIIEELKYEAVVSLRFMMTCRDTLILELQRLDGKGGIDADSGKTLRDCFTTFIANFSVVQKDAIIKKFYFGLPKATKAPFQSVKEFDWRMLTDKDPAYRYEAICPFKEELGLAKSGSLTGLGRISKKRKPYYYQDGD